MLIDTRFLRALSPNDSAVAPPALSLFLLQEEEQVAARGTHETPVTAGVTLVQRGLDGILLAGPIRGDAWKCWAPFRVRGEVNVKNSIVIVWPDERSDGELE